MKFCILQIYLKDLIFTMCGHLCVRLCENTCVCMQACECTHACAMDVLVSWSVEKSFTSPELGATILTKPSNMLTGKQTWELGRASSALNCWARANLNKHSLSSHPILQHTQNYIPGKNKESHAHPSEFLDTINKQVIFLKCLGDQEPLLFLIPAE